MRGGLVSILSLIAAVVGIVVAAIKAIAWLLAYVIVIVIGLGQRRPSHRVRLRVIVLRPFQGAKPQWGLTQGGVTLALG